MIRRGTVRLLTAVAMSALGIIVAILAGEPEAAILVIPWAVLLVLGLARSQAGSMDVRVGVVGDRLLVGDEVEVATTITGMHGSAFVSVNPSRAFWPDETDEEKLRGSKIHDVLRSDQSPVEVTLGAEQWGVHDLGRVEVAVTDPYGLFCWKAEVQQPHVVQVHPTPAEIQNLLSPWLVRRVTGAHGSRVVGRGVEYADIRHFAPGDSLRDINWKASARSPEIWVSQRHPDRATDVVLLVDSFVESGHDVRTVFGLAIEAAMALAESHLAVADRVGLVELGGTVRWVRPAAGRHHLQRLSDALISTGLHSYVAERNLGLLTSRALPPRSFVVALTPMLDDRFIDALFILGGKGHDVAVVECEAAIPTGYDEGAHLAQRLWEAERQITRDRLAEHGIALARWRRGDPLDLTLIEITNRRRRVVRGRHR